MWMTLLKPEFTSKHSEKRKKAIDMQNDTKYQSIS